MAKPVLITTPFPSIQEVAEVLGVSKRRVRQLTVHMQEIWGKEDGLKVPAKARKARIQLRKVERRASKRGRQ